MGKVQRLPAIAERLLIARHRLGIVKRRLLSLLRLGFACASFPLALLFLLLLFGEISLTLRKCIVGFCHSTCLSAGI